MAKRVDGVPTAVVFWQSHDVPRLVRLIAINVHSGAILYRYYAKYHIIRHSMRDNACIHYILFPLVSRVNGGMRGTFTRYLLTVRIEILKIT